MLTVRRSNASPFLHSKAKSANVHKLFSKKVLTKPFIGYNIITRVSTRTLRVLMRKGGGKDAW